MAPLFSPTKCRNFAIVSNDHQAGTGQRRALLAASVTLPAGLSGSAFFSGEQSTLINRLILRLSSLLSDKRIQINRLSIWKLYCTFTLAILATKNYREDRHVENSAAHPKQVPPKLFQENSKLAFFKTFYSLLTSITL